MAELLSSKVAIIEEEPTVRGIPSAPSSVAGAVGLAERGPIGEALLCTSFEGFRTTFGGFTPDADLALAAMGFFENGGTQLWAVRTTHYADISDPASATAARAAGFVTAGGGPTPAVLVGAPGPFALQDGDLIRLAVDGAADVDAIFQGTAAAVVAVGPGPFPLADGMTLLVQIDVLLEQEVVFAALDFVDITNATSLEVAAALNAGLVGGRATVPGGVLRLASDVAGRASRIQVAGTARGVLGFPDAAVMGSGNVANLRGVGVREIEGIVEAAIPTVEVALGPNGEIEIHTVTTGLGASLQAGAATAAAFGLDGVLHQGAASGAANALLVEGKDPGSYANRIELEVRAATNGAADAFDLMVVEDGVYRETFPNLVMAPDAARYVERLVNDARRGSLYVHVRDQLLAGAPVPPPQTVLLAGGDDGFAGLDENDFIGSEAGKTGLRALDTIQAVSVILVPGHATPAIHNALLRYCEVDRDGKAFAVLDPPANQRATDIVTYVSVTAAIENLSEFGAIYWPRVRVLNPAKGVFGATDQLVVPPSGIIAGVYSRTDASRPGGVYRSPAGINVGRMFGVLGFETDEVLEERKRDLVYPHRINPLTTGPGLPRFIDGSRTLKGDGNFPYIGERRGVIFIERSIKQGLEFARHENNTEGLRAQVRRIITAFLLTQMNNGAFRSRVPAKAFFVDVSDELNTATVIFAGQLIARVGLATNKPAEFVIVRITQDTRALEAELGAAGA